MKKIISLVLAVLMFVSAVPFCASAENLLWNGFLYTITDGEATIVSGRSVQENDVVIPSEINGYPVTRIASKAFFNDRSVSSLVIPDSVTYIGDHAFAEIESLKKVTIGNGVTTIDEYAFTKCESLEEVTFGDSVETIGGGAFFYCANLTTVKFGKNVKSIGDYAFAGTGLKSIELPEGIEIIEDGTFTKCKSLTSVKIPSTVKIIGKGAFSSCSALTGPGKIPYGVTEIRRDAFNGCTKLESIIVPNTVEYMGEFAFLGSRIEFEGAPGEFHSYYGMDYEKTKVYYYYGPMEQHVHDYTYSVNTPNWDYQRCTGEWKEMHYCICDNYITETKEALGHDDSDHDGICNRCRHDSTEGCGHICHKDGFSELIYKFCLFFWKLFKTNKECACGIYHY